MQLNEKLIPIIARSNQYNQARIWFEEDGNEEDLIDVCEKLDTEAGRKRLEPGGYLKAAFRAISAARAEKAKGK